MLYKNVLCVILQVLIVVNSVFISNIYSDNCHQILKDKLDTVVFKHEMDIFFLY